MPRLIRDRECYWCGARRLRKNLRRITLAGPARRRVYECRAKCKKDNFITGRPTCSK